MDSLVSFCIDEIALDGTSLDRLWGSVLQFLRNGPLQDNIPETIDDSLKTRLWTHLLHHTEITLKAGDQILKQLAPLTSCQSKLVTDTLALPGLLTQYGDTLRLTTSENKQWLSITGFPKRGNPVPNLNYKLLSCISRARETGIAQPDAARETQQDPRSLYSRTKMLIELGLMSPPLLLPRLTGRVKRPFVHNGNTTYQLIHTRYLSSNDPKPVTASADQEDPVEGTQEDTLEVIGLGRDQTIGHQVTEAVGKGPWEKRTLYNKLAGQSFRVPIENFLEHANLSKPIVPKKPPQPKKPKVRKRKSKKDKEAEGVTAPTRRSAKTVPPPEKIVQENSVATDQPAGQPTTDVPASEQTTLSKRRHQPKRKSDVLIPPTMTTQLRFQTPTNPRKPITNFAPTELATLKSTLLALLASNGGVLDLSFRLENEYLQFSQKHAPNAPGQVDFRVLNDVWDVLEGEGRVKRVMISAMSPIGTQFKSVLVLPEIDPLSDERVGRLRTGMALEWGVGEEETAIDVVRAEGRGKKNGKIAKAGHKGDISRVADGEPVHGPIESSLAVATVQKRTVHNKRKRKSENPLPIDDTASQRKRQRVPFKAPEDQQIWQAVALIQTYHPLKHPLWSLLSQAFPGRKPSSLHRRWEASARKISAVPKFLETFERKWKEAGRGEVSIQTGEEIHSLLDWVKENIHEDFSDGEIMSAIIVEEPKVKLPGTLEDLKKCYDITSDASQGNWREEYNKKDGSSFARRRNALYSTTFLVPLPPPPPTPEQVWEAQLESLIKSVALTPDTQHNKDKARTALAAFGRDSVKKVLDVLSDHKLLTKNKGEEKFVPGRAYRMSDMWTYHARSRFGSQLLGQSAAFYNSLMKILGEDKEMLVSELTDDGSMFCLIEFLASQQKCADGKISLHPTGDKFETGNPANSYRGRSADKSGFDFGVLVSKAPELRSDGWTLASEKLPARQTGEPQAWISPTGDLFDKTLSHLKDMVYTVVYLQPGIQKRQLIEISGKVVTLRECEVLLDCLADDGLIKARPFYGSEEGYFVAEWD